MEPSDPYHKLNTMASKYGAQTKETQQKQEQENQQRSLSLREGLSGGGNLDDSGTTGKTPDNENYVVDSGVTQDSGVDTVNCR